MNITRTNNQPNFRASVNIPKEMAESINKLELGSIGGYVHRDFPESGSIVDCIHRDLSKAGGDNILHTVIVEDTPRIPGLKNFFVRSIDANTGQIAKIALFDNRISSDKGPPRFLAYLQDMSNLTEKLLKALDNKGKYKKIFEGMQEMEDVEGINYISKTLDSFKLKNLENLQNDLQEKNKNGEKGKFENLVFFNLD